MAEDGKMNGSQEEADNASKPPLIPKFSSFKPPPKSSSKPPESKYSRGQDDPELLRKESRKHKISRDEERDARKHKSDHRSRERSRSRSPARHRDKRRRTISPSDAPPLAPNQQPAEAELFKYDIKGDWANVTYGTTYRYSVPLFHRFGAGYVLGLSPIFRIDREKGEGKGIVVGIRGHDTDKRRRGGNLFAVDASRVGRLKAVEGVSPGFDPEDEFIALSARPGDRPAHEEIVEQDYRSIEGKAKTSLPDDVQAVSDDDEDTLPYSEELRQRTVELDRKLQSHPHDIDTWLEYVALQDDLGAGQKASTADIKIGILQKALTKNPGNTKLFVELFKLEAILWEPKKVLAHWEEVLQKYENPELIVEYLNYRQTSFVTFTYPSIVAIYTKCLATLRKLAWGANPKERPEIERTILYVYQRFAHLARETGYDELAIALFQALVELNLFRPASRPATSEKEREVELEQFEEFWDSECPRFGEQNALGWNAFDPDAPVPETEPVQDDDIYGDDIESWYRREEESKGNMPARTTDDLNDDDPYHVILFNDIRPFLYTFTTDVIREMPYALLLFCGLRLPPSHMSSNEPFMSDTWLHSSFNLEGFWPITTGTRSIEWVDGEAVEPERLSGIPHPFGFKRKVWPVNFDTLFPATDQWFQQIEHSDFYNPSFVSAALHQLKAIIQDETFMIYHLAIENILSTTTVLKLAKSYIKVRKTSLALYNVYALLLWRRNDLEEARKVWKTAIEMSFSTRSDPVTLWQTWITSEFEQDIKFARGLLSKVSAERPDFAAAPNVGGAGEMKTRRYLQDQFDRAVSFRHHEAIEGYAFLIVLLEYLSSNLEPAVRKCDQIVETLKSKDLSGKQRHERILLTVSKILYRHTKIQGWYRSSTLRDFWFEAISSFPHNTAFLSLYTWNEASSRIDGRVRKLLGTLEKTATVDSWIFAVWAEISIERGHVFEFGVRSILEKIAESDRKMSPLLWLIYIEFEARFGKPQRAKDLVFRAVRECPWCKDLMMMAFGMLRELFSKDELARVYSVLMEKEIRIHRELERIMEGNVMKQIELPHDESTDEE